MGGWDTKSWLRAIGLALIVLAAIVLVLWSYWSNDETTTDAFITGHVHPGRHRLTAVNYREIMRRRFTQWRELVCLQPAI